VASTDAKKITWRIIDGNAIDGNAPEFLPQVFYTEESAQAEANTLNECQPWSVVQVSALPDYRLHVRFRDGTTGEVDMATLVESEGEFTELREFAKFVLVDVKHGAPSWFNGLNLAPDVLHAGIKAHGCYVLR
jgi:hypothetical protein